MMQNLSPTPLNKILTDEIETADVTKTIMSFLNETRDKYIQIQNKISGDSLNEPSHDEEEFYRDYNKLIDMMKVIPSCDGKLYYANMINDLAPMYDITDQAIYKHCLKRQECLFLNK